MDDSLKPQLKFETSWDDGDLKDLKLADLLRKYNIPATFYIPGCTELTDNEILGLSKDFEIGGHTMTHPVDMKILSNEDLYYEIDVNKRLLENITGKQITKFCYPRGRYNERVTDQVKKSGYKLARTTICLKTENTNPFRYDTTIHAFPRKEYKGLDWVAAAHRYVEYAQISNGYFHLWGHSWEIEYMLHWQKLEMFFDWLTENYKLIYPKEEDNK